MSRVEPTKGPQVKICCIGGQAEAWLAIREAVDAPVFLAGGLNAENVA